MYTIKKEFEFCASHSLKGLPEDHPCSKTHGHNYKVIIEMESDVLDSTGMVLDYRKMDLIKRQLDAVFDHKHLNELVYFDETKNTSPTAENLAKIIFELFMPMYRHILTAVTVCETPKTSATYRPKK